MYTKSKLPSRNDNNKKRTRTTLKTADLKKERTHEEVLKEIKTPDMLFIDFNKTVGN